MDYVSFPNLGITIQLNKVALDLGFVKIHWYALIIVTGIILAYLLACKIAKKEGITADTMSDVLLYALPSAIIGARIYYVTFNFSQYKDNFWDAFKIYEGGIAIYGAIIGALISTYIYAKIKKIPFLKIFDIGAYGLFVGQAVGRWGNFVNQEAYGGETNNLFAMTGNQIQIDILGVEAGLLSRLTPEVNVHPTFLYESVWNILGLVILLFLYKKKTRDGQMFFLYLLWYGIGRFFIEGLRTDSLMLGVFRVSQLLAAVSVVFSVVMLIILGRKIDEQQ